MNDLDNIKNDLKELLFVSSFFIDKKSFKKERKKIQKLINKIESEEFSDILRGELNE